MMNIPKPKTNHKSILIKPSEALIAINMTFNMDITIDIAIAATYKQRD